MPHSTLGIREASGGAWLFHCLVSIGVRGSCGVRDFLAASTGSGWSFRQRVNAALRAISALRSGVNLEARARSALPRCLRVTIVFCENTNLSSLSLPEFRTYCNESSYRFNRRGTLKSILNRKALPYRSGSLPRSKNGNVSVSRSGMSKRHYSF
jgi:hypothetical protein